MHGKINIHKILRWCKRFSLNFLNTRLREKLICRSVEYHLSSCVTFLSCLSKCNCQILEKQFCKVKTSDCMIKLNIFPHNRTAFYFIFILKVKASYSYCLGHERKPSYRKDWVLIFIRRFWQIKEIYRSPTFFSS